MSQSIKFQELKIDEKLEIAEYFFWKIFNIEQKELYSDLEVSNLIKELEDISYFPSIEIYIDLHYKKAKTRDLVISSVNRIRSVFHKILKDNNANPLEL